MSPRRTAITMVGTVLTICSVMALREIESRPAATAVDAQPENLSAVPRNTVTALGRIEPDDGVIRVAGPSQPAVVIGELLIDDNDRVRAGQPIAVLDTHAVSEAVVHEVDAELRNAEAEWRRQLALRGTGVVSSSEYETWETRVAALRARRQRAAAELDLTVVRSPVDGQVLEVHARRGERVGPDGIAEIGKTNQMVVVAEIYESDVRRVRVGAPATISSVALETPIHGAVSRIGLKIGKKDVLGVDPTARTDARVVEVEIRLDDSAQAAGFTNLEVDVEIGP